MKYEQEARERQGMLDEITQLKTMLKDMEVDFVKCAHGISPCFFCANDDTCTGCPKDCNFVWKNH